ncbi:MlaD family protein [Nocardia africana]|uniref:Virulence factor Mce family protein n=1 Tax=Nocardia africana TaxID=134964 RepID=A0A378X1J1_9NOCA|nr:MlaD family protein [Nocardia africana]MCC3312269.1 MlaD family protein [Nocardia africana]SUA46423.1 virulence factor Mce family protein [Nocardia africana]
MKLRNAVSLLGLSAVAVGSVLYMNVLGLGLEPSPYDRDATLTVGDTNGLIVGSKVLLRGVAIGEIAQVTPDVHGVRIRMKYKGSYRISTQSRFRIDTLSALGEAYVSVLPPSSAGPYLTNHAQVPAANVTVPTTVQELSARLTRLMEQVHPDQVRDIMNQLDLALPDDSVVLVDLNRAWSLYEQMITSRADDLSVVLDKFQALLADSVWLPKSLAGTSVDIRKFGVDMGNWLSHSGDVVLEAPFPDGISKGTGPFIDELQKFLDKAAPGLQVLGVTTLPAVRAGASAIRTLNTADLLDSAIANTANGALTVHVSTPGK